MSFRPAFLPKHILRQFCCYLMDCGCGSKTAECSRQAGLRRRRLRPARLLQKSQLFATDYSGNCCRKVAGAACEGPRIAGLRQPEAASRAARWAAACCWKSSPRMFAHPPPSGGRAGCSRNPIFRQTICLKICGIIHSRSCIASGDATFGCSRLRRDPRSSRR